MPQKNRFLTRTLTFSLLVSTALFFSQCKKDSQEPLIDPSTPSEVAPNPSPAPTPDPGTTAPSPGTTTPDPGTTTPTTPDAGTTTPTTPDPANPTSPSTPGTSTPAPGTTTPAPGTTNPNPGTTNPGTSKPGTTTPAPTTPAPKPTPAPTPAPAPAPGVNGITSSSYYLEKALPAGYVKDGSVDYTSYIQAALDKNANIVFPGFPLLINDKGLNIGSNKTITFLTGSELRMKPSSLGNYKLLQIRGASNVTLYNPVLKGDRYKHLGTSGEWGMGLAMYGASNVTVYNLKASEFWGDGLYIADNSGVPSKNIVVSGVNATYNRRDNISVISVDGLKLENVYVANANGTLPMAGLNFEPNTPKDELKNITVTNFVSEGNKGPGLKFPISTLYGGSNKTISITINNAVDKGSERAVYATLYKKGKQVAGETIGGVIQLNNISMERNTMQPMTVNLEDKNLRINIVNPKVIDKSGKVYQGDAAKTYLTNKNYLNTNTNYSITF